MTMTSQGALPLYLCLIVMTCSMHASMDTKPQHDRATIGVLMGLHKSGSSKNKCGQLNLPQVQHFLAAQWAAQVVNNQSDPQGTHIEINLFDTCGDRDLAMRDIFFALKGALDHRNDKPLLGLIGLGDPDIINATVRTLHSFDIPLILASPRLSEMVSQEGNILTSAPDISGVVKPVLEVARELGAVTVSIISTCPSSINKFGEIAETQGIAIGRILQLDKYSNVIGEVVKKFLNEAEANETIALILEPTDIYTMGEYLRSHRLQKNILITGAIGLNRNLVKLWKNLFAGSYVVEPHMPELPDFRNYLLDLMQAAQMNENQLVRDYMQAVYNCGWEDQPYYPLSCSNLQRNNLAQKLQINPEVSFVVKAVSAYSAALFLHCVGRRLEDCSRGKNNLHQGMLMTLSQLSFTSQHNVPFELQGTSRRVTHEGQLIPNKYVISFVESNGDVAQVGWYSSDQGLALDYSVPSTLTSRRHHNIQQHEHTGNRLILDPSVDAKRITPYNLITSPWATVVLAIAVVGIFMTLFILSYVLVKMCDGTVSGNQSLGVLLLLAIALLYTSVVLFALPTCEWRCHIRAFLHPLSLSLCYGILIVKVMQLRSLVLLGLGGRISYVNQYIILFFIVLVQLVIHIQWFIANQSRLQVYACYMPATDFMLLHSYVMILMMIAFIYGLSVLKIRRNYKEGHWVTLASFLSIPVFIVWGLVTALASDWWLEPAICVTLLCLATILVLVIFIPKVNTISKQSSHFKHKKIQLANSVTTVFTTYTDLEARQKHYFTPTHSVACGQPLSATMLGTCGESKTPVYAIRKGSYL